MCQEPTYAPQQIRRGFRPSLARTSSVVDKVVARRTRSIRWDESIRNFDSNLAIVADRARMERQEGIFHRILRDGLACGRSRFNKARLVLEDCFDQLVGQIFRKIRAANREIV